MPVHSRAACLTLAGAMLAGTALPAVAQGYDAPPPAYEVQYRSSYQARYTPAYDPADQAYPPRYDPGDPPRHDSGYQPQATYRDQDDLVIYGRRERVPDDAEALSQSVWYGDLDLYYPEDRRELRRRITLTARDLCDRLGEDSGYAPLGSSCRDEATRDALRRVGTVEAHWVPRGSYVVR